MTRRKVILSAYACEPCKGSEPGVGWNWAKQIARFSDVWVITRQNNRETIEQELSKNPVNGLHVVYFDLPPWLSFWKRGSKGMHLYYLLWQVGVFFRIRKLAKGQAADILHHVTFGSALLPTFLPLLKCRFIWGPIGGAERVAIGFRKDWPLGAQLRESARSALVLSLQMNPFFRIACRRAERILVKTEETARRIPSGDAWKVIITTDVAASSDVHIWGKGLAPLRCSASAGFSVGGALTWLFQRSARRRSWQMCSGL